MTSTFLGGAIALSEGKWIDKPCYHCGRLGIHEFRGGVIVCRDHLTAAIRAWEHCRKGGGPLREPLPVER